MKETRERKKINHNEMESSVYLKFLCNMRYTVRVEANDEYFAKTGGRSNNFTKKSKLFQRYVTDPRDFISQETLTDDGMSEKRRAI